MANKKYYYRAVICYANTKIFGDKFFNYFESEAQLVDFKKYYCLNNDITFIGVVKYDAKTDTPVFLT